MTPNTVLIVLSVLATYISQSSAGPVGVNGTCNLAHNKLASDTKQFTSDCTATTYCGPDSICHPKGCRRDEYPYGYRLYSHEIPPKCPRGEFCPDEGDACQQLMPLGSLCQLNRDDECQPPPDWKELAGPNNFNGSVCLNFQCMWANVTLGETCVVENTQYISYEAGTNTQFSNVVSRGNCVTGNYCDAVSLKCMAQATIGGTCQTNKECLSNNCAENGVCGKPANSTTHLATGVYVVVGLAIAGIMGGILGGLYVMHRRYRGEEREKRAQYWREQETFRQNIMQMREQARSSLLSLPFQSDSPTISSPPLERNYPPSETSQTTMLRAAAMPSGLRSEIDHDDDGRSGENGSNGSTEDTLVMHARPMGYSRTNGSVTNSRRPPPRRL